MPIHPTAVVDPMAEVDSSADIGPYVITEGLVNIGARARISAFVAIAGFTCLATGCEVFPHVSNKHAPQDQAYDGSGSDTLEGAI